MADWLKVLELYGPMILAGIPQTQKIAPMVTQAIAAAEEMHTATGMQKKEHALTLVREGVLGLNAAAGKTVVDPEEIVHGVSSGIDTTVHVVNVIHRTGVDVNAVQGVADQQDVVAQPAGPDGNVSTEAPKPAA